MNNHYSLRLYDQELLEFTLEDQGLRGVQAHITRINTIHQKLLPLDLEPTNKGVLKWLERRVIPKHRAYVEHILASLGLSHNNTKGIIDICKGLSLNDSFWVVPAGFGGLFADYNLYDNQFSEMLALVAYTGVGQSDQGFTTSPELTTQGMLRKAWRRLPDGNIYLYKGGSEGAVNTGNEPYNEYYACQIAEAMGLEAVTYNLEYWKEVLASTCKLFPDKDTAFIPIGRIVREGGLQACLDYYATLGDSFVQQLRSMLVFDAVIYNEDRHFGNFGVLRDNHTGDIVSPVPIFDNGLSLFNYAMQDDLAHIEDYAKTRSNPYGVPFETICKEVMGAAQKSQLQRLQGFTFRRHPSINFSEERLVALENHLAQRVDTLLHLG